MVDLDAPFVPKDGSLPWIYLRASEFLEHAGMRHCVVGDAVARRLGSPVLIGDVFIAVADEQLEEACSVLLRRGLKTTKQEPELCYPGCSAHGFSALGLTEPSRVAILLVPASSWCLDLSPASISENTFLLEDTLVRFPNTLFYIDSLIHAIAVGFGRPGVESNIACYLHLQYLYVAVLLSRDAILSLPPEDQFFKELFDKVILRSLKKKVCEQWRQIRNGHASVDEARKRIPRPDLKIAAAKEKYRKQREQAVEPSGPG